MKNKNITLQLLLSFMLFILSGFSHAETYSNNSASDTAENSVDNITINDEERISAIGVIAPSDEPNVDQIEAMTSDANPPEETLNSATDSLFTDTLRDPDSLDESDASEALNIFEGSPEEDLVETSRKATQKKAENKESSTEDSKTKKIQQSVAGAVDPKLLDDEEYKAAEWPMRVPKIPVKFDWVLLKKGELFGGDLFSMYQDEVEFDSDEVGVVSIDMEDILQIRTKTIMSVRFLDNSIIWGKVVVTEKELFFIDSPDRVFDRKDILTISPAEQEGQSLWDGEFSIGLNFKTGNSARFDYLLSATARRLSTSGRFTMSYTGVYAEVDSEETAGSVTTENNHRINIGYDYFSTKQMYYRLPYFEYYSDPFKNIDIQSTLGVAVGYEVIDKKIWKNQDIELNVYAGPSFQYTRFSQVEVGVEDESQSAVLAAGFDFDFDLTNKTEFFFVYDAKLMNKASGTFISYLKVGFDIEVIDDFDIEIATMVDYIASPTANELGEVPESTDTLFAVSLEYDF